MKLLEFFTVTEPDMLLEAAKDRYMQMLPEETLMKFYTVPEALPELNQHLDLSLYNPKPMLDFWKKEVEFAVGNLKRADRVMWYLRYIKVYCLRWGLSVMYKHIQKASELLMGGLWVDKEPEINQVFAQLEQQYKKLENKVNAELRKLQQNTTKFNLELIKHYDDAREEAHKLYKEAYAARQAEDNRNTRSRLTNAEAAWQRTIKLSDAVNSIGADQSGEQTAAATNPQGSGSVGAAVHNYKDRLNHYMGIPDQRIQEFNWGFVLMYSMHNLFTIWENEWAQKQARTIPHDDESWEGAEKIIEFSDGTAWFNIHRSWCNKEGKAMGHCGNSYRKERPVEVLTFRSPEGDDGWKVNLTFIWNTQTGMIEESKGFNNLKPDRKYHPYILELLKQPWIKGLDQSMSHDPENNFSIEDLEEEQQKEITELNPRLAGYIDEAEWLKKYGKEPEIKYPDGSVWASIGTMTDGAFVYSVPFENDSGKFWKQRLAIDIMRGNVAYMGLHASRRGKLEPAEKEEDLRRIGEVLLQIEDIRAFDSRLRDNNRSNQLSDFPKDIQEKIYNDKPVLLGAWSNEQILAMEDAGRLAHTFDDGSKVFEAQEQNGTGLYSLKPINTPNDPNSKIHWIKDIGVRTTKSGEVKSMAALMPSREDRRRDPTEEDWRKIATILMMPGVNIILPDEIMLQNSLTKNDIPEHLMKEIGEVKPSMVSFKLWAEKEGITEELLLSAATMASFKGLNHAYGLVKQRYVVENYKDGWMDMYGSDLPAWYESHMDRNYEEGSPYDIHKRMEYANAHAGETRWYEDFVRTIHERPVIYDRRKTLDWIQARYQSAEENPEADVPVISFWVRIDKVLDAVDGPSKNYYIPQVSLLSIGSANFHEEVGDEGDESE